MRPTNVPANSHESPDDLEQRAARSVAIPIEECILSEVTALIPSARLIIIWRKSGARYVFGDANFIEAYRDEQFHRNVASARSKLGIRVFSGWAESVGEVPWRHTVLRPIAVTLGQVRQSIKWGFSARCCQDEYIIEGYGSARPPDVTSLDLIGTIVRFERAYKHSTQLLSSSPVRSFSSYISSPLTRIQDDLFKRLKTRLGPLAVHQTHLFLLDPEDQFLYFASTEHLPPPNRVPKLPRRALSDEQLTYIRSQVKSLQERTHDHKLLATYDRLLNHEMSKREAQEKHETLRLLLRALPQEIETGVAGDAVRTRSLVIGGEPGTGVRDPRWIRRTQNRKLFLHKLLLEQAFGIAKTGNLAAVPIRDGPQIVGVLFSVVAAIDKPTIRALLDTVLEAGDLLSSYRRDDFLRSVARSLAGTYEVSVEDVIASHLAKLIFHEVLIVLRHEGQNIECRAVWRRVPPSFRRSQMPREQHTNLFSRPVREFVSSVNRSWQIKEVPEGLRSEPVFWPWQPPPQSAVFIPFGEEFTFVFFLREETRQLTLGMRHIEEKALLLDTLVSLSEALRQASSYVRQWQIVRFAAHKFPKRYVFPFQFFSSRLLHPIASGATEDLSEIVRLAKIASENIELRARVMESQFRALASEQGQKRSEESTGTAVDLTTLLRRDLDHFFGPYRAYRDEETSGAGYEDLVRLDTRGVEDGLRVPGNRDELLVAFYDLLENSLSKEAIGPDVLREDPRRGILEIRARIVREKWVEVTVRDRGSGMSRADVIARNEFLRRVVEGRLTSSELSPFAAGSGIGLRHAATVIGGIHGADGLRGHMTLKSRQGSGTTVTVLLPCHGALTKGTRG